MIKAISSCILIIITSWYAIKSHSETNPHEMYENNQQNLIQTETIDSNTQVTCGDKNLIYFELPEGFFDSYKDINNRKITIQLSTKDSVCHRIDSTELDTERLEDADILIKPPKGQHLSLIISKPDISNLADNDSQMNNGLFILGY